MIPTAGFVTVAFNLFGRGRGHFVTCNRLLSSSSEIKRIETADQLYVGKRLT
jgi:hypothetical protein